jgi:hypothetical protein
MVTFFSGAFVAIVAALVAHIFSIRRESQNRRHAEKADKEARKRNFISFADGFRAEAERSAPRKLSEIFPARVYRFREEAAKIRGDIDLSRQEEFANLVTALCRLRDNEVEEVGDGANYIGRDRVCTAIDAVTNFLG